MDHERAIKVIRHPFHAAGGPEDGLLRGVDYLHAESGAIAEGSPYLLSEVVQVNRHLADGVALQPGQNVLDQRHTSDGQECFWQRQGEWSQPGTLTGGQNHGLHLGNPCQLRYITAPAPGKWSPGRGYCLRHSVGKLGARHRYDLNP